ncbi:MAG: hypothetical protein HUK00_06255 [Bacteroidaceae bacterium]|nr:hypothetical protein [Bacteroidaceae bacterium]
MKKEYVTPAVETMEIHCAKYLNLPGSQDNTYDIEYDESEEIDDSSKIV